MTCLVQSFSYCDENQVKAIGSTIAFAVVDNSGRTIYTANDCSKFKVIWV